MNYSSKIGRQDKKKMNAFCRIFQNLFKTGQVFET